MINSNLIDEIGFRVLYVLKYSVVRQSCKTHDDPSTWIFLLQLKLSYTVCWTYIDCLVIVWVNFDIDWNWYSQLYFILLTMKSIDKWIITDMECIWWNGVILMEYKL